MCLQWGMSVFNEACWSPIRHVGLRWGMLVSDGYPMRHVGLQWGMSVSDGSPIGLRWVFDRSPIVIIFLWTPERSMNLQILKYGIWINYFKGNFGGTGIPSLRRDCPEFRLPRISVVRNSVKMTEFFSLNGIPVDDKLRRNSAGHPWPSPITAHL